MNKDGGDPLVTNLTLTRLLVANRGEIAVRVIRACHDLGIEAVAIHSESDAGALHTRLADIAIDLGAGPTSENYLNGAKLIETAKAQGADAIHPGYGFLAENADFARAVEAAGLVFVGPPAGAIEVMGEKVASRQAAIAAGVPLAPGSKGTVDSADAVVEFGTEHGYPLVIKASFGGGGRGMRRVGSAEEAHEAFDAAVREATAAFGRGEVYVERYLENARHVEVQVFADSHGNTVYYGDRDCSIQRRHQKLIEEAPAPGLSQQMRQEMGQAAVRLAVEVHYRGAGTVEFLVEGDKFYFLEMNTRIQVEHPVTEQVTGIDLVQEQIRVAAGEALGQPQSISPECKHAIEVRINAEDTSAGVFVPAPGKIDTVSIPETEHLRWDSGFESGDSVSPHYDSLIGKLVVTAPTRDEAISALDAALGELTIDGVPTTAEAARAIISTEDFRSVTIGTLWLECRFDWALMEPASRQEVEVGGHIYLIPVFSDAPADGADSAASSSAPKQQSAGLSGRGSLGRKSRAGVSGSAISAPMQGTIVRVNAQPGDQVSAGDLLFVLEAMKMENPITAARDGVIASVSVEVGSTVSAGEVVAEFEQGES